MIIGLKGEFRKAVRKVSTELPRLNNADGHIDSISSGSPQRQGNKYQSDDDEKCMLQGFAGKGTSAQLIM